MSKGLTVREGLRAWFLGGDLRSQPNRGRHAGGFLGEFVTLLVFFTFRASLTVSSCKLATARLRAPLGHRRKGVCYQPVGA
jgi:hypothetical protein